MAPTTPGKRTPIVIVSEVAKQGWVRLCHLLLPLPTVGLSSFPRFLVSTVPRGVGGGPVYALDLTPLIRMLPYSSQLGLDPRLAQSWDGLPVEDVVHSCVNCRDPNDYTGKGAGPFPPTPWEAAILQGDAAEPRDFTPKNCSRHDPSYVGLETQCRLDGVLKWHLIAAVGEHVRWTPQGLDIVTAGPRDAGSVVVDDITTAQLEPGALNVSEWQSPTCAGSGLRYPVMSSNLKGESGFGRGLEGGVTFAAGRGPRLGHLGSTSIVFHGGSLNLLPVAMNAGAEFLLTITRDHLEAATATTGDLSGFLDGNELSPGLAGTLPSNISRSLDDVVIVWGLWSDVVEQSSPIPPPQFSRGTVEVPVCRLPSAMAVFSQLPTHPLAAAGVDLEAELAAMCDNATSRVLPPSLGPSQEYAAFSSTVGNPFDSPEAIIDAGVQGYQAVVTAGAYGPRAAGFDIAFLTPGGFARWPAVTIRHLYELARERSHDSHLVTLAGCTSAIFTTFEALLCL